MSIGHAIMIKEIEAVSEKHGIVDYFAKMDKGALGVYLIICIGCAAAMLINMAMQNVGLTAMLSGNEEEQKLVLLTVAVVTFCAIGTGVILLAIKQKSEQSNYSRSSLKGKKR